MPPPRLSAVDASFLYLERPRTPMHVGAVAVVPRRRPAGFDYERLVETVERRLAAVPRYRQRVRRVPGDLARPVWVDDADFDIAFHVRRSALPRPGTTAQLTELVARLMSRPLDPDRPLWEMYLVEGLADGRFAVITKTHQAMVDGVTTIDIGQVLLDATPDPAPSRPSELWMPRPEPTDAQLVAQAVADAVARPARAGRHACATPPATLTAGAARLLRGRRRAARHASRPADGWRPGSPLNVAVVDPAPVRRRARRPRRVPGGAGRARLHGERRRAHRRHGRAARRGCCPAASR